jgi:hypothetical protein
MTFKLEGHEESKQKKKIVSKNKDSIISLKNDRERLKKIIHIFLFADIISGLIAFISLVSYLMS